jgi:hypothetical protein
MKLYLFLFIYLMHILVVATSDEIKPREAKLYFCNLWTASPITDELRLRFYSFSAKQDSAKQLAAVQNPLDFVNSLIDAPTSSPGSGDSIVTVLRIDLDTGIGIRWYVDRGIISVNSVKYVKTEGEFDVYVELDHICTKKLNAVGVEFFKSLPVDKSRFWLRDAKIRR